MCTVSMVMDHYGDEWQRRLSPPRPLFQPINPFGPPYAPPGSPPPYLVPPPVRPVTQDEVDEFRRLLERAREYDRKNNEPDCELAEKRQKLLDLAKQLGVDISFVTGAA